MQADDVGLNQQLVEAAPLAQRVGVPRARCVDQPTPEGDQHRREQTRNRAVSDQADSASAEFADTVLELGIEPLAAPHRGIEARQPAQHGEHQRERQFRHRARIGAGKVAHRNAACLRRIQIDRVDADADFLDQPQLRRRGDHLGRAALEHVPDYVGLGQQADKRRVVVLGADGYVKIRNGRETRRKIRAGGVMEENVQGSGGLILLPLPLREGVGGRG